VKDCWSQVVVPPDAQDGWCHPATYIHTHTTSDFIQFTYFIYYYSYQLVALAQW